MLVLVCVYELQLAVLLFVLARCGSFITSWKMAKFGKCLQNSYCPPKSVPFWYGLRTLCKMVNFWDFNSGLFKQRIQEKFIFLRLNINKIRFKKKLNMCTSTTISFLYWIFNLSIFIFLLVLGYWIFAVSLSIDLIDYLWQINGYAQLPQASLEFSSYQRFALLIQHN